jgi:ADP-ribose pyrophosphatase YjhB (NUDIX family)
MIETPKLTTDVIIRVWEKNRFQGIVLIDRKNPPLGLAIPGGFVEVGESVETAALREIEDGIWSFYFGPVLVSRYDERQQRLHRT